MAVLISHTSAKKLHFIFQPELHSNDVKTRPLVT